MHIGIWGGRRHDRNSPVREQYLRGSYVKAEDLLKGTVQRSKVLKFSLLRADLLYY
jgi:hypothetical protein